MKDEPIDHAFEMANRIQCLAIEFEAFGMIQMAYDPTFKFNTDEEIKKLIPTAVVRHSSVELVELHLIDKHHIQHIVDWCAEMKVRTDEAMIKEEK